MGQKFPTLLIFRGKTNGPKENELKKIFLFKKVIYLLNSQLMLGLIMIFLFIGLNKFDFLLVFIKVLKILYLY
jgi:hypothetical protein